MECGHEGPESKKMQSCSMSCCRDIEQSAQRTGHRAEQEIDVPAASEGEPSVSPDAPMREELGGMPWLKIAIGLAVIGALSFAYRVFVDGVLKLDRLDEHRSYPQGRIALAAYTGGVGRCTVYYDNVVVSGLE